MTPLLFACNLRKTHGERVVLDVEHLQLLRGAAYLLLGANGAGKTTLLRMLAGLETGQEGGTFTFSGVRCDLAAERARLAPRMIYIHQHSCLFNTSVAKNIGYGLVRAGVPRRVRAEQVHEAMEWAGVGHLADVSPHRLSGGEKQRVALARAWVLKPQLLLLDEPTSNLDEAARAQVAQLIHHMRDANNCVLIATHDHDLMALEGLIRWQLDAGRFNFPD